MVALGGDSVISTLCLAFSQDRYYPGINLSGRRLSLSESMEDTSGRRLEDWSLLKGYNDVGTSTILHIQYRHSLYSTGLIGLK